MSTPRVRAWLRMLAVCGVVVAVDQAAKGAVVSSLEPGERVDVALGFELARVTNSGIAFGLLVGGALGNLADRIRDNGVTDFLDPPLWPAFNLADIAITAGVVVVALIAFSAPAKTPAEP